MPTIREIASYSGVSSSTVSIVLNGKSEERKIPEATQKKVWEAARKLNYHPNVTARRLRIKPSESFILAVFWATDFRAPMMVRFLKGLQEAIMLSDKKCEIVIHPYENNRLGKSVQALEICNAAIICNASGEDIKFLEEHAFSVPIVLYNRHSDKYCTVNVDDELIGAIPAKVFAGRGHSNAVIINSGSVFPGMDVRVESFINYAGKAGIKVQQIYQENSMKGGYLAGKTISNMQPLPDCVFSVSDALAFGALRSFSQSGISVPGNIEIISVGNGDQDMDEYSVISLSVVNVPMEKMAGACLRLVFDIMFGRVAPPYSINLPIQYIARETCGDSRD